MVEIKITGETPLEALASLTAFGLHCIGEPDVYDAAKRILEAGEAKERKEAAKSFTTGTAPTNSQTLANLPPESYVEDPPRDAPAPEPEFKPDPRPKPPALAEVRAKGLEAARAHGHPAVKAILDLYGVPNITALGEDDRAAFLKALEGLEGQGEGNA